MLQGSALGRVPIWVTHRIENEAVEHYRAIGCLSPVEEREPLTVDLVQRDDLSPDGDPNLIEHHPTQIRVTGIRLSPDEAKSLARLLNLAANLATGTTRSASRRHCGGWNGGYGLAPTKPVSCGPGGRQSA